jgi:Na+/phosphate symporter
MLIYLSLVVAIAGLIVYIISGKPEWKEVGRLSFFAGLFVFLMQGVPHLVAIATK